ncbi:MAG: GCN5-related N-acetyltransferase [Ramlibacter sp.]|nr:GCN5-related N-acetyltransferase [Ramlibacter sp.]
MTRDELALAIDWAAQEGWNPGLHDAGAFHAADPQGFFVGELAGEPVASISVVKYGASLAFLGLYIVLPAFRGRGLGWALWQHGMASAAGRRVGLDGVLAQQDNYRKSGFTLAWRNVRYQGTGGPQLARDPRVVPLLTLPFKTVAGYDRPFFPGGRSRFLRAWLQQADAAAFGFIEAGRLQGYGLVRRCRSGWKIGPLFADSEVAAEALYAALAAQAAAGEPVLLDLPEPNAAASALARRHGMKMVFETARMYTGEAPSIPMERLYGVTSFELG